LILAMLNVTSANFVAWPQSWKYVVWYIEGIQDLGKGIIPEGVECFGIVCGETI